jgi:hypothetical protein
MKSIAILIVALAITAVATEVKDTRAQALARLDQASRGLEYIQAGEEVELPEYTQRVYSTTEGWVSVVVKPTADTTAAMTAAITPKR